MRPLAMLIIQVTEMHEQSWDAAKKKYRLSIRECIAKFTAHSDHERYLVDILLSAAWNDSQKWAKEVLK